MRIKKKNLARLSSLTALGAGALGVAAGTAEAGVIYEDFGGTPISFPTGSSSFRFGATAGAPGLRASGWATRTIAYTGAGDIGDYLMRFTYYFFRSDVYLNGFGGLRFRPDDAIPGAAWNMLPGSTSYLRLARRSGYSWVSSRAEQNRNIHNTSYGSFYTTTTGPWFQNTQGVSSNGDPNGPKGPFYKLFSFTSGSQDLYGWVKLNVVANGPARMVDDSLDNPGDTQVDLIAYAYSNSGYMLPAGDITEPSDVPEPGTAGLLSLGALALGAAGMRRWRAARRKAA